MMRRWAALARKAWHRPPAAVLKGIQRECRRQIERPWTRIRPRLFDDRALLKATGAASLDELWSALSEQPFFVNPSRLPVAAAAFRARYPQSVPQIVAAAEDVLGHRFDLLGSGLRTFGASLPWHVDFKTGREWPISFCHDLEYENLGDPSDVKVPWELSRCQHFTLLGQAHRLTGDPRFAAEFVAEATDWIHRNPWGHSVNWICPMDVALRAVSWIWGFYFLADSPPCTDVAFRSAFLRSLYLHGEYVAAHIEHADVNGNHYLCDGVGLVFLGTFFQRTAAGNAWLAAGERMVTAEILRQVHEDGVDFEKSVAYHRLVLEAFLTTFRLLSLNGRQVPDSCWHRLQRMFHFTAAYTPPDGRAPLVGDADDGRVQRLGPQSIGDHRYLLSTGAAIAGDRSLKTAAGRFWEESFWLLGADGAAAFDDLPGGPMPASAAFPRGGFYAMRSGRSHVFIDCGEVGMNGVGGHGHNDILSFELVLDGARLVSDSGSYLYTASREMRNRFRATAAHNTVQVDGAELNRFISPDDLWRLRDDARPVDVAWHPATTDAPWDYFRGAHTGYDREPHRVHHVREIALDHRQPVLIVRDRLTGSGIHDFVWRFHFAADVEASAAGGGVVLRVAGREFRMLIAGVAPESLRLERDWISPSYGVKVESTTAVISYTGAVPVQAEVLFTSLAPGSVEFESARRLLDRRS